MDKNEFDHKSLLGNIWQINNVDERLVLSSSQKNDISPFLAKLLLLRNIDENLVSNFLLPDFKNNLPDPFLLNDMKKSVDRVIYALKNDEKIGIIADYDVDGSTSASILYKFLEKYSKKITVKIPNRLNEGYGPNIRIMDEMLAKDVKLIFTLDCGTTAFNIIDNKKYSSIDTIIIDHHISESICPNVFSIINPNKLEDKSGFNQLAAVGVTFLFLMALRKSLRSINYFNKHNLEPNLLNLIDLVAIGTVCDVVDLTDYNRVFVIEGLKLILNRKNKVISKLIDNSNYISTPTSTDLAFNIGPQLNAASRIDDSFLPFKLLTNKDMSEIEKISRKLLLLNEKRKLIENQIYEEALIQAEKQKNSNFILVYGNNWHNGVIGIIASKLVSKFNKPSIVISFGNSYGTGSARSIQSIDLSKIIHLAKDKNILIDGGGHKMAAGIKIKKNLLTKFKSFLDDFFEDYSENLFVKINKYDSLLSLDKINSDLMDEILKLEPFGAGNNEPQFIIKDIKIQKTQIIKDKHVLIFFQNDFSTNLKGICFNCINSVLGDYLLNYKKYKFLIGCTIKKDNFSSIPVPQIIIKDAMIIN